VYRITVALFLLLIFLFIYLISFAVVFLSDSFM
jgi:hypothetical protein